MTNLRMKTPAMNVGGLRKWSRGAVAAMAILVCTARLEAEAPNPRDLRFPPLTFEPPKVETRTLTNGVKVLLVENHELPTFEMELWVRAGWQYESLDKTGLGGIFGSAMREGGTATREPDALNEELESMAASVETWVNEEAAGLRCTCLTKYMDKTLEIFGDVLFNAAFREDKLRQRKQEEVEQIRRRNDNPGGITSREFNRAIYGPSHPSGWRSEPETVEAITREDLVAYHRKFFVPHGAMLAASGDFKADEMLQKLEKLLGAWKGQAPEDPALPEVQGDPKRKVYLVEKEIAQTHLRIGHLGVKRHNPDRYALRVMDEILGGGSFTSRFVREIRSRRGLAYSVWSYFTEGRDRGIIVGGGQTKAESTAQTVALILELTKEITEKPVSQEELSIAKESIINSFVFRFDSLSKVVKQKLYLQYFGFPDDYLETYTKKIEAVTAEDVHRVAKTYLHPERAAILAVGDPKKFDRPLSEYGEVEVIKLRDYQAEAVPVKENP